MTHPAPRRRGSAPAVLFAILGLLVAGGAGFVYWRQETTMVVPRTPEETVQLFLDGVFTYNDPARLDGVTCAGWAPADAIARTEQEFKGEVHVSWEAPVVVNAAAAGRVTLNARLAVRQVDDRLGTFQQQWRFNLVDEDGWRVCDARPFVAA